VIIATATYYTAKLILEQRLTQTAFPGKPEGASLAFEFVGNWRPTQQSFEVKRRIHKPMISKSFNIFCLN